MPDVQHDLISLLHYLAPGFIAAGLFYATTAHPKPSQFERIVQALILTVIVHAIVIAERGIAHTLGNVISFGPWTAESTLFARLVTAVVAGAGMSVAANHDYLFDWLRRLGATQRTSYPSEWFGVFSQQHRFVTLNLKDGSRLSGWPSVWPESSEKGHFFVTDGVWNSGSAIPNPGELKDILIDVTDVTRVEFNSRVRP